MAPREATHAVHPSLCAPVVAPTACSGGVVATRPGTRPCVRLAHHAPILLPPGVDVCACRCPPMCFLTLFEHMDGYPAWCSRRLPLVFAAVHGPKPRGKRVLHDRSSLQGRRQCQCACWVYHGHPPQAKSREVHAVRWPLWWLPPLWRWQPPPVAPPGGVSPQP